MPLPPPPPFKPPQTPQPQGPINVLPTTRLQSLKQGVVETIAKNMGVATTDLPQDVVTEVDKQVSSALSESIRELARLQIERKVKGELTQAAPVQALLKDRMQGALQGISLVSQSTDVKMIMDENAKLLKKKYDCLVNAGFTKEEAFQIVITELGKPKR